MDAYDSAKIYKKKTKVLHEKQFFESCLHENREFSIILVYIYFLGSCNHSGVIYFADFEP